jgi:hypothetical protein
MSPLRVFMWMLPEIWAMLLVIAGPIIYRNVIGGIVTKAISCLKIDSKNAMALADFYLDFNLATVATLLLGFNLPKLAARYWLQSDTALLLMVFAFIYLVIAFFWLWFVYNHSTVCDYLKTTDEKINIFRVKKWKWGRVSGSSGLMIWWTRFIPAAFAIFQSFLLAPK